MDCRRFFLLFIALSTIRLQQSGLNLAYAASQDLQGSHLRAQPAQLRGRRALATQEASATHRAPQTVQRWEEKHPLLPSQLGQDAWAMCHAGGRPGFFLDLGAREPKFISNSWALERAGWAGICVEPFPKEGAFEAEGRTCDLHKSVVSNVTGQKVQFATGGEFEGINTTHSGEYGGINTTIDHHRMKAMRLEFTYVEVTTISLNDLLERAKAPAQIDYFSIDTEGTEYDILNALDWDKYRFTAISVEHNYEEPKRSLIYHLLVNKGYEREFSRLYDDWYISAERSQQQRCDGPAPVGCANALMLISNHTWESGLSPLDMTDLDCSSVAEHWQLDTATVLVSTSTVPVAVTTNTMVWLVGALVATAVTLSTVWRSCATTSGQKSRMQD